MWIEFDNTMINLDHYQELYKETDLTYDGGKTYSVVLTNYGSEHKELHGTEQQTQARYEEIKEKLIGTKPKENYNWCDLSIMDKSETPQWYCKCGSGLHGHENYCPSCGAKINW